MMTDALCAEVLTARDRITLLAPDQLLPTEEFIEERVLQVTRDILHEGFWLEPILVERTSLVIMDGHHRREFARRHSLLWVPCLMLDYSQVELESRQVGLDISPDEVIARGLQRRPYPAKTTRHVVHAALNHQCRYALSELAREPITTDQRCVLSTTDCCIE